MCGPTEGKTNTANGILPQTSMVGWPVHECNVSVYTQFSLQTTEIEGPSVSNGDGITDFSCIDVETRESCATTLPPSPIHDDNTGTKRHRSTSAISHTHEPSMSPALLASDIHFKDSPISKMPSAGKSGTSGTTQPASDPPASTTPLSDNQEPTAAGLQPVQPSRKRRRVTDRTTQGRCAQVGNIGHLLTRMIDPLPPTWFQVQMKCLKAMNLGPQWEQLLDTWLKLEATHGFKGAVSTVVLHTGKSQSAR